MVWVGWVVKVQITVMVDLKVDWLFDFVFVVRERGLDLYAREHLEWSLYKLDSCYMTRGWLCECDARGCSVSLNRWLNVCGM